MAVAQKLNGDAERNMSDAEQGVINPTPIRLTGALAAATVIAKNTTVEVRVQIPAVTTLYVMVKFTSITGTATVNGYPMLSDATALDNTDGTAFPIGLPTALTITNTTAQEMSYTNKGVEFFDVSISMSNGGSDTATLTYVDVYGI